jgi:hypothetical protein
MEILNTIAAIEGDCKLKYICNPSQEIELVAVQGDCKLKYICSPIQEIELVAVQGDCKLKYICNPKEMCLSSTRFGCAENTDKAVQLLLFDI